MTDATEYHDRIANQIRAEYKFITLRESETLYFFNPLDGQYHEGETYLNELVRRATATSYSISNLREIKQLIMVDTYVPSKNFICPTEWINLKNGAYNIQTHEVIFRKDKPEGEEEKAKWKKEQTDEFAKFNFTSTIPIKYDPHASCPKIDQFFHQVQEGDDNVLRLYEIVGYCLLKRYDIKKMFLFVGPHDSGKSTVSALLGKFIGDDNYSALSLQAIQEDVFEKIKLLDKYANISGELAPKFIRDTSILKELMGMDTISVRVMHSQKVRQFVNFAKLFFLANQIPATYESDDAYYQKVEIIEFMHQFLEGEKETKNRSQLMEELTTENELSGLFNKSVEALHGLLKRGKFTASKSSQMNKEIYRVKSNPLKYFIEESIGLEDEEPNYSDSSIKVSANAYKSDVYNNFIAMLELYNIPGWTQTRFFTALNKHLKQEGIISRHDVKGVSFYPQIYMKKLWIKKSDDVDPY